MMERCNDCFNPIEVCSCSDAAAGAMSVQVDGDHYKKYPIQPIEFMHRNQLPGPESHILSYIVRWRDKGGVKDLKKAIHILEMMIEMEGRK